MQDKREVDSRWMSDRSDRLNWTQENRRLKTCDYTTKLHNTTKWLQKAGRRDQKRFMVGVLLRCQSIEILENVYNVLKVILGKDYTYTRCRVNPEDIATSLERGSAATPDALYLEMIHLWEWFTTSPRCSRVNYLFGLLALCDSELLHVLLKIIHVLLVPEKHNVVQFGKDLAVTEEDSSSVLDSNLFFYNDDPEMDLLAQASSLYEQVSFSYDPQNTGAMEMMDRPELGVSTVNNFCLSKLKEIILRNHEKLDITVDSSQTVTPRSSEFMSGFSQQRDFIRALPVNIAKKILGLLEKETLQICKHVSQHWCYLTEEIFTELSMQRMVEKQAKILMGSPSSVINPFYAKIREVLVPIQENEKHTYPAMTLPENKDIRGFESVYSSVKTRAVQMEERNVYCGVFNIMVLLKRDDPSRVIHYGGGRTVVLGSKDRAIRLLDVVLVKEKPPLMQGHAGSIRAVLVCEEKELVISASYDLSIRCWNLKTGACVMIFYGHTGTISCLDLHGNHLVSGARDCKVKVWNMKTGVCCERMKLRHRKPVLCVKINMSVVLSGCEGGVVKMWNMETADLLKVIKAHQGSVKCLFIDQFHVVSGGSDGQVLAWSTDQDFKQCLMTFHHPRAVLTLSVHFLRIITGCVDGNIRIFNFLSGDCLRVIRLSANKSPIFSLHTHHNTILVNNSTRVLLLQFAQEDWDYNAPSETKCVSDPPAHKLTDGSDLTKMRETKSITSSHHPSPSMQHKQDNESSKQVMTPSKRKVQKCVNRGPNQPLTIIQVLSSFPPTHQFYDLAASNEKLNTFLRDSRESQTGPYLPSPHHKILKCSHLAPKPSSCSKGTFKIYTPFKSHCSSILPLMFSRPWTEPPGLRSQLSHPVYGASRSSTINTNFDPPEKIFMRNVHDMKHTNCLFALELPSKCNNHLELFRKQGGF